MRCRWKIPIAVTRVMAVTAVSAGDDAIRPSSPVKRWEVRPTSLVALGQPPLQTAQAESERALKCPTTIPTSACCLSLNGSCIDMK